MKNVTKVFHFPLQNFLLLFTCLFSSITLLAQTTTFTEVTKLVADARNSFDGFGEDVDIDGDFAVVGEPLDSYDENEMNVVQRAGKTHILKKVNGQWEIIQVIAAPNRAAFDYFGNTVAISGDYIFACKPFSLNSQGQVYIYKRDGGDSDNFSLVQTIQASIPDDNSFFGYRLDVNGDYAVISAFREKRDAVGGGTTRNAGAVYIFQNIAGTWTEIKRMESPNRSQDGDYGASVAIDGDNIVVGEWNYDMSGMTNIGGAYVYNKDTGGANNWGLVTQLAPSAVGAYLRFGGAVDISGDNIVVGAHEDDHGGALTSDIGAAYVYNRNTGGTNNWGEVKRLVATNPALTDHFGISVAIDGNLIVVGAEQEDDDVSNMNPMNDAGSVFFFKRNIGGTNNWGLMNKGVPSARDMNDQFGNAVAIDGCTVIIGCKENNSDGDNANYMSSGPGAAYIFGNELYTEMSVTPATCDVDAVVTATNGTAVNYEFFVDANANRQWDAGETVQNGASTTYTTTGLTPTDEVGVIVTNSAGERCETIVDIIKNCIRLDVSVNLWGAMDMPTTPGEMRTDLATSNLVPLTEPYTGLSFTHVGDGGGETTTMAVLGDATLGVVDWVFLEVRDPNTPTTVLGTTAGLLLKNGKVVDGTGTGFPDFSLPPNKEYHVAVKHRNHLSVMTATPMILNY